MEDSKILLINNAEKKYRAFITPIRNDINIIFDYLIAESPYVKHILLKCIVSDSEIIINSETRQDIDTIKYLKACIVNAFSIFITYQLPDYYFLEEMILFYNGRYGKVHGRRLREASIDTSTMAVNNLKNLKTLYKTAEINLPLFE